MKKFSETDLDRSWSEEEVKGLSEGNLTKLAFLRDLKNLAFFAPCGFALYVLVGRLGVIGTILGWGGMIMFGGFALYNIFTAGLCAFSLIGAPLFEQESKTRKVAWNSLQLILSLFNLVAYAALGYLVYLGMNKSSA